MSQHQAVFVSGASGFVGTAVIRELLARDYRVHALVHRRPLQIQDARITTFQGELDDRGALYPALERVSAAIHLVGIISENRGHNVTFRRMHVDFTRAVVDGTPKRLNVASVGSHKTKIAFAGALKSCNSHPMSLLKRLVIPAACVLT